MAPDFTFVPASGDDAATAPTAEAASLAVNYFCTEDTYALGMVSRTGRTFGAAVERTADHRITFYTDGVAVDCW